MMFSAEHVDSLFASTRMGLARSYQLLEERRTPSAALNAAASSRRPGILRPTLEAGVSPPAFAPTVHAIEGLSHLGSLMDVSRTMVSRLVAEAAQPSPNVVKQRAKGKRFPLTQRMVKAATVAAAQGASMEGDAQALWSDSTLAASDAPHTGSSSLTLDGGGDAVGGAALSSLLVRCAFCVDGVELLVRASSPESGGTTHSTSPDRLPDHELLSLLRDFSQAVPPVLLSCTIHAIVSQLQPQSLDVDSRSPTAGTSPSRLPLALVHFPSLVAYVLLEGAPFIAAEAVFKPLEAESGALLAAYLQSAAACEVKAQACVLFFSSITRALLLSLAPTTAASADRAAMAPRVLASLKRLVAVFVTPIEVSFTASVARVGMTEALYAALVVPLTTRLGDVIAEAATALGINPDHDPMMESARALLHTGVYRLLMVIESVGASELYVASGSASAVSQQKQYQERLRQSNGKLTTSIFSSLVEDRQLVIENTNARSEGGHRVLKITDGVHKEPTVFAYLDDGAVFVKHGRVGKFRAAASVEEVFHVFDSTACSD